MTDKRDLADAMLEPMRQRERARRGSDLSDEARFNLLARGELHTCGREGCSDTVSFEGDEYCGAACYEQRNQPVDASPVRTNDSPNHGWRPIEPDVPEAETAPECPVCEGDGYAPAGTYSPARASVPACNECHGTGKADPRDAPVIREDFDSLAAEYGFHGPEERPDLLAIVEANRDLPPGVVREGDKLVYRGGNRDIEAEQCRITLKLTLLRSAGIDVGWTTGRFNLVEPALDAIIQLVAERDDLKQRLHRAAARCTLTAETISSLAAGDEE